jgi:hypothetical protein
MTSLLTVLLFLMQQLLVNGDLLSHGSFILQSECTAHNYPSDLSGTKNANILCGNNFKLIHTQNKLPCLKFHQLTKHYSGNVVCLFCKTVRLLVVSYGWAKTVLTQHNKRQVSNIFFIHPVINSTKGIIQRMSQQDILSLLLKT